jgi:exosortase H (IPTLxxWG-CTERM-specific)
MQRRRGRRGTCEQRTGVRARPAGKLEDHSPPMRDLRKEVSRSCLVFLLILLVSYSVLVTEWGQRSIMKPASELTAEAAALLIKVFDRGVIADGATVRSTWFSVEVKEGCNGIHAVIIPLAGVIAFPTTWRKKVIGALFILLGLSVINTIRVVTLVIVLAKRPGLFGELHDYLWQFVIIIVGALMWLFWYGKIVIRSDHSASA